MSDNTYKYITDRLTEDEILCQLAEEAAELAQAALKLRRAITGTNPTPTDKYKALANLLEEVVDVQNAINAFKYKRGEDFHEYIEHTITYKRIRWEERLREKERKERAGNAEG